MKIPRFLVKCMCNKDLFLVSVQKNIPLVCRNLFVLLIMLYRVSNKHWFLKCTVSFFVSLGLNYYSFDYLNLSESVISIFEKFASKILSFLFLSSHLHDKIPLKLK